MQNDALPLQVIRLASKTFAGDKGFSGPEIMDFFRQYADDIPDYWELDVVPSRWVLFEDCLKRFPTGKQRGILLELCSWKGPMKWGRPEPSAMATLRRLLLEGVPVDRFPRELAEIHVQTVREEMWDVFICHASEDKEAVARPLANALSGKGLEVWYDEFTLTLGDSLRRSINHGLAQSRYGVVILTPGFFAKEWPQRELDGLAALEVDGEKKILPVWHNVTREDVARFSPILADRLAVSTAEGFDTVVDKILRVVRPVQVDDIGPQDISDTGRVTIPERFRKVLALQHELEILLSTLRVGLEVDKSQLLPTLVVISSFRRDYDELLETYRVWELKTRKLLREYAPEEEGRLTSALRKMHDPLYYLRGGSPPDPQRWFDMVKKPLGDIGVFVRELGRELTVSIASELPYEFMEHFYDPSTERRAASPGHIRLLQKAECSYSTHPAIFEHPPQQGDAILTYHLRGLPEPPAKFRLSFRYGVVDKLYEEPSGALIAESDFRSFEGNHVIFLIRVNGKEILRSPQYGHEWSPTIERGPVEAPQGELAVEFRTNAMGEPRGNWAAWGEPKLVEVTPTSSAAG